MNAMVQQPDSTFSLNTDYANIHIFNFSSQPAAKDWGMK